MAGRLGEAIRSARLARGFTQSALARHALVNQSTIYRMEEGLSYPELETLQQIASVLDLDFEDLWARRQEDYQRYLASKASLVMKRREIRGQAAPGQTDKGTHRDAATGGGAALPVLAAGDPAARSKKETKRRETRAVVAQRRPADSALRSLCKALVELVAKQDPAFARELGDVIRRYAPDWVPAPGETADKRA